MSRNTVKHQKGYTKEPVERTCEHALKFVGILEATSLLELANHTGLGVVRRGVAVDKASGEHSRIEFLENILVLNVLENGHYLRQGSVEFRLFHPSTALPQEDIGILGK